ncbi:hypothetical protein L249_7627 [Ophiocordyceps polyrhachis-furcata BCC 54312]|uniref:Uncharacterized protein n=1 Tax=Ophiocordyceps polyrhachis-furcata BCC 54312 TaxID=1330021 RepID=A0A367LA77_9HYPO|nr:hypothetical protein L249_7627 [Ophiocordyceps polyrhachis-furcata BCC 54312]
MRNVSSTVNIRLLAYLLSLLLTASTPRPLLPLLTTPLLLPRARRPVEHRLLSLSCNRSRTSASPRMPLRPKLAKLRLIYRAGRPNASDLAINVYNCFNVNLLRCAANNPALRLRVARPRGRFVSVASAASGSAFLFLVVSVIVVALVAAVFVVAVIITPSPPRASSAATRPSRAAILPHC